VTQFTSGEVTRIHETGKDQGQHRILPTWVALTDQNNPNWNEQDSSVWSIQNFQWRDLTLRKRRDTTSVRPIDFKVHYEIVAVAFASAFPHGKPVPRSPRAPAKDAHGLLSYEGPPHPPVQMDDPIKTNPILHQWNPVDAKPGPATGKREQGSVQESYDGCRVDKGCQAHQGRPAKGEPFAQDRKGRNPARGVSDPQFPDGQVYKFDSVLVERARTEGGQVYLALYGLHDEQLIKLLGRKRA